MTEVLPVGIAALHGNSAKQVGSLCEPHTDLQAEAVGSACDIDIGYLSMSRVRGCVFIRYHERIGKQEVSKYHDGLRCDSFESSGPSLPTSELLGFRALGCKSSCS